MGIANSIRRSSGNFDVTRSPLVYVDFVIVVVTLLFLQNLGLQAASQYSLLIVTGMILLVFGFLLFREGDFIGKIFPINSSLDKDILVRYIGLSIPILLLLFSSLFALNLYNPLTIAPLAQFNQPSSVETFSAIKASASPAVSGFIIILGASRVEEIVLGLAFVVAGVFATYLFVLLYEGVSHKKLSINTRNNVLFTGGMILSILFFTLLHIFNSTYANNPSLFIFAAIFRLVLNILIYKLFFLGLTFSVSFHEAWNAIAVGKAVLIPFLTSTAGLLYITFNLLLLTYMFIRIKPVSKEFMKIITMRSRF